MSLQPQEDALLHAHCSSINLNRLYRGKGKYVRFRSAESVINELQEAKRKIKT